MAKSLQVVVPSVHMKPSMAYSTEIASQKMKISSQQYEMGMKFLPFNIKLFSAI